MISRSHSSNSQVIVYGLHFLLIATYIFELFIILPKLYGKDVWTKERYAHVIAGTWILFNVLTSIWKFMFTSASINTVKKMFLSQSQWKNCEKCKSAYPPRAYHCVDCGTCILVRDHHCLIGSNCVGYSNRRYFILMVFYLWLALLYANVLNMSLYQLLDFKSLLTMTLPWLAWLLGYADVVSIILGVFVSFCVVSFILASFMLSVHLRTTLSGRTSYEVKKKFGEKYNLGLLKNLENAFGVNWKYAWLSPFIPSKLPGDGMNFDESYREKDL